MMGRILLPLGPIHRGRHKSSIIAIHSLLHKPFPILRLRSRRGRRRRRSRRRRRRKRIPNTKRNFNPIPSILIHTTIIDPRRRNDSRRRRRRRICIISGTFSIVTRSFSNSVSSPCSHALMLMSPLTRISVHRFLFRISTNTHPYHPQPHPSS